MNDPKFLGPYRICDVLGRGGMGTVYRARHEKTGEDVAVKLIATQVSDEMRFRRRFHSEIETLRRLKHPNIVRLIGYGEEQGMLFYSMEYVAGESLHSIIRREKRMAWKTVLDIAIQTCSALKHAHDFGVIHRDLKPANLIIQEDGTVKLVDFGISKIFGHEQTAAGSVMGTADYMAPEQALDTGITPRTDLYALGCVMYAMLCGRPPFRGKNITEVISALKERDPVPLDLIDPAFPEDIVQIVSELLEKLPGDRPPTALAVMNRLKAMRAGLSHRQTLLGDASVSDANDADMRASSEPSGGTGKSPADQTTETSKRGSGEERDAGTDAGDERKRETDSELPETPDTVATKPGDVAEDTGAQFAVDPAAGTVRNERPQDKSPTELGTERAEARDRSPTDSSPGNGGQTHFQTVSEGEVRESVFSHPQGPTEKHSARWFSVVLLSAILLVGGILVAVMLQGPTADEVLAKIESYDEETQSLELQHELERFLKLFPNHPQADEVQRRRMVSRVESVVRRLKLKSKLRPSEPPLYEQAFLEAMELRETDPAAASEKLRRWIAVFKDSSMSENDERVNLAELAEFEAERLEAVAEQDFQGRDPKLSELLDRIEAAEQLPQQERRKLLEGIVTLYEDQPWAEEARQQAIERLERE